jgi:hypothetical protein
MTKILAENVMEIGEREASTFNKKQDDSNCGNIIDDEEDNDKGEDPGQDEEEEDREDHYPRNPLLYQIGNHKE